MKVRSALPSVIAAGFGVAALVLASCSSIQRTVMAPPQVEGATFVGNQACVDCHRDFTRAFPSSPHARLHLEGVPREQNAGCESCHGPGSLHVKAGGGRGKFIVNALREGCTMCHQPHGSIADKMLVQRDNNLCLKCHAQVATATGQIYIGDQSHTEFLSRGSCWSARCHTAVHGSNIDRQLRY